jgi:hypothetical protein
MRRPVLLIALAAVVGGCGGTATTTTASRTPPSEGAPTTPASHGQTIAPPPGRGVPQPAGPASLSVTPSTVRPGAAITVTLHPPTGTRQAVITLAAAGATVSVRATPGGGGFIARLVVPRSVPGGFWPVVARYGAGTPARSATAQVKVVTP